MSHISQAVRQLAGDKSRLLVIAIIVFGLLVVGVLVSQSVLTLVYNYSAGFEPPTTATVAVLLLVLSLISLVVAYAFLRIRWYPRSARYPLIAYLVIISLIMALNLAAYFSIMYNAGASGLTGHLQLVSVQPKDFIFSGQARFEHTHSLKPVLYYALGHIVNVSTFSIDMGNALIPFFPTWVTYPVVVLCVLFLLAYLLLLSHTVNISSGLMAPFSVLMLTGASLGFIYAVFDGGPFCEASALGIGLFVTYLLCMYVKKFSLRWVAAFALLPTVSLVIFSLVGYAIANSFTVSLETQFFVSTVALLSVVVYAVSAAASGRGLQRVPILVALIFVTLLAVNLVTVRPVIGVSSSANADSYVYMDLSTVVTNSSTYLARISGLPALSNLSILLNVNSLLVVRANVDQAGINSAYLARNILGKNYGALADSTIFVFSDPTLYSNVTLYVPLNGSRTLTELNVSVPSGFTSSQISLMLYADMHVPYVIYQYPDLSTSIGQLAINSISEVIPVTSLDVWVQEQLDVLFESDTL